MTFKTPFLYKIEIININKSKTRKMTEIICIPNIENYTQEIINGELILTPKKQYITENELNMIHITHSKIEECVIKKKRRNYIDKQKICYCFS